jgi:hypothetical protein
MLPAHNPGGPTNLLVLRSQGDAGFGYRDVWKMKIRMPRLALRQWEALVATADKSGHYMSILPVSGGCVAVSYTALRTIYARPTHIGNSRLELQID